MASSALESLRRDNAAKLSAATRRYKTQKLEAMFYRKGAGLLTAATFGTLNRLDVSVSVGWFPWKLAVSGLALAVEASTGGKLQAAAAGVNEATTAIYVERSISENTLIVGQGAPTGYIAAAPAPAAAVYEEAAVVTDGGEM